MRDAVERRGKSVLCIGDAGGRSRGWFTMTDHGNGSIVRSPGCDDAITRARAFDVRAIIEAAIKLLD